MDAKLEQQIRVSKRLSLAFALSLLGVGGIGSLVALIIGLWAKSIISKSSGEITGIRMAWWCIIVGALGTVFLPVAIVLAVLAKR